MKLKIGDSNFDVKNSLLIIFVLYLFLWCFYLLCCIIENYLFEDILVSLVEIVVDLLGWILYFWWV